MLEQSTNLKKPQNSNKVISKPEISSGELHATFVGNYVVDGTETQRKRPGPIAARERGPGLGSGSEARVAGPVIIHRPRPLSLRVIQARTERS